MGNKKDCSNVSVFFSEWQRMCKSYASTGQCPFHTPVNNGCGACVSFDVRCVSGEKLDHLVRIVQKWSDEHLVEIDWLKVPPNTPVMIKTCKDSEWKPRHFAVYLPKLSRKFGVFNENYAQEDATCMYWYDICKLADEVDPTPYYKEVEE